MNAVACPSWEGMLAGAEKGHSTVRSGASKSWRRMVPNTSQAQVASMPRGMVASTGCSPTATSVHPVSAAPIGMAAATRPSAQNSPSAHCFACLGCSAHYFGCRGFSEEGNPTR